MAGFFGSGGSSKERFHPKLVLLFPLGDDSNEPLSVGPKLNTVVGTPTLVSGKRGYARQFNGSQAYAHSASSGVELNIVAPGYNWTIMFWIYPTDITGTKTIYVVRSISALRNIRVRINAGALEVRGETTTYMKKNNIVSANTWQHFAITYDYVSPNWSLYKDGSPVTLDVNNSGTTDTVLYIGMLGTFYDRFPAIGGIVSGLTPTVSEGFVGIIDDVRGYMGILSAEEIVSEMNKTYGQG